MALLEWFRLLPDTVQVAIAGLVAERLTQGLKWLAERAGWMVPDDKLKKYALALVGAAVVALVQAGAGPEFWSAFGNALLAAVFLHETGANFARAITKAKKKEVAP